MCAYGAAGDGLRRACISSAAAIVAFSVEDLNIIFELCMFMLSMSEWLSMDIRCYDMWCHLLESRHIF